MMRLHQMIFSGNCYKVRLLLAQLGIPYETVDLDPRAGETRTEAFLARNPIGRVPVLEIEPGVYLPESNAILFYLAEGTEFLPSDRLARAQVLSWMFFEQYSHEPYIAVARNWISYAGIPEGKQRELRERQGKGYAALDVMERELRQRAFLVGDRYTIADIALYAYTHVSAEGGFDLGRYPSIRAWIDRVASRPRHVPLTARTSRPS